MVIKGGWETGAGWKAGSCHTSQDALCLLLRIVGVSESHGMSSGDLGRNLPTEVFAPVADDPCNPLYSTSTRGRWSALRLQYPQGSDFLLPGALSAPLTGWLTKSMSP